MRKEVLVILLLVLVGCTAQEIDTEVVDTEVLIQDEAPEEPIPIEEFREDTTEPEVPIPEAIREEPKEFRLEIPTDAERETLPECGALFTTFPVDMSEVRSITPIGNLGPPGHTFPTDHPHLHMGEHGSGAAFDIYAPADIYLTTVSWGDGMTEDPRDYTIYFALCKDVMAYYNHVKTVSAELQNILDEVGCESFSGSGCTKVLDLNKIEAGEVLGVVGLQQGNWDFGLIDLRVDLDFVKPQRYPERSLHIQCPFDYYPEDMKNVFYALIDRDDGSCSGTMQDVPGTLRGNWFHETSPETKVVDWNVYLAFVGDYEFSEVQVVSVAGIFTEPGKFEFEPKDSGTINRDFAQVTPGGLYCYGSEDVGKWYPGAEGKIVVEMLDEETLQIEHQSGTCTGSETLTNPETYRR